MLAGLVAYDYRRQRGRDGHSTLGGRGRLEFFMPNGHKISKSRSRSEPLFLKSPLLSQQGSGKEVIRQLFCSFLLDHEMPNEKPELCLSFDQPDISSKLLVSSQNSGFRSSL